MSELKSRNRGGANYDIWKGCSLMSELKSRNLKEGKVQHMIGCSLMSELKSRNLFIGINVLQVVVV